MVSKQKVQKEKIFDIFSKNLEWLKEDSRISLNLTNAYICPICLKVFTKADLCNDVANPLTLEDIPPKSLGGKPLALTCKKCNSEGGTKLDIHILKRLLEHDSKSFLPKSKIKFSYRSNGHEVNGTFEVEANGTYKMNIMPNWTNPQNYNEFMRDISPVVYYNPYFNPDKPEKEYQTSYITMKYNIFSDKRRANIALLRIAYLLAFATLGNSFLLNTNLIKIREQIINPDKDIIPVDYCLNCKLPSECEGINIISIPKKLQCFLIVFNLKTQSATRQFAIVLPGLSDNGIDIYKSFEELSSIERGLKSINFQIEHIPMKDFLHNRKGVFASQWYWQKFTNEI